MGNGSSRVIAALSLQPDGMRLRALLPAMGSLGAMSCHSGVPVVVGVGHCSAAPVRTYMTEGEESLAAVQRILEAELPSRRLDIYEAGGGSTSYLSPDLLRRSDVIVVDLDADQIARCTYATTKHVGDIQSFRLQDDSIDLVTCFNVIEHLHDVQGALSGFATAVRPGGLLFIGAPHPHSLSGVVTRFTPHWFHVWYYRSMLHYADAGKPGHPPFPTIFHPLVTPERLKEFLSKLGFEAIYERVYESDRYPDMRSRHPQIARLIDLSAMAMNIVARGDVRHGDYHMVFRKRQPTKI
jgi:SAM-dependent methyltransferase